MAAPSARPDPVLDLSTLHEGAPIRIDGRLYHILSADALSLRALKQLETLAPRVGVLLQRADLVDADAEECSDGLARICTLILDAPPEVQARLSDQQRVRVMEAFTQLRSSRAATPAGANTTASAGRKRSPGSRGSTAARPRTGTRPSPSA